MTASAYGFFGPTSVTFGSADSDTFQFDADTGRQTGYTFNVGSKVLASTLTWNGNGTLQKLAITDPFTSSNTQTCTNSYDDLTRLVHNNCGSIWNQSFSYDVFGNIAKTGTISFQPTYGSNNQFTHVPVGAVSYDKNGNVLTDGFHTYTWDAEGKNTGLASGPAMTYL